jgi:hypothetical protein
MLVGKSKRENHWTGRDATIMVRSFTTRMRRTPMFCTIREYDGVTDTAQAIQKVEGELLPAIRDMEGFHSYMLVNCGEGNIASVSLFDTMDQANACNDQVAELVEKMLGDIVPEEPTITVGEVVIQNSR